LAQGFAATMDSDEDDVCCPPAPEDDFEDEVIAPPPPPAPGPPPARAPAAARHPLAPRRGEFGAWLVWPGRRDGHASSSSAPAPAVSREAGAATIPCLVGALARVVWTFSEEPRMGAGERWKRGATPWGHVVYSISECWAFDDQRRVDARLLDEPGANLELEEATSDVHVDSSGLTVEDVLARQGIPFDAVLHVDADTVDRFRSGLSCVARTVDLFLQVRDGLLVKDHPTTRIVTMLRGEVGVATSRRTVDGTSRGRGH
jgi:hypothetical protein